MEVEVGSAVLRACRSCKVHGNSTLQALVFVAHVQNKTKPYGTSTVMKSIVVLSLWHRRNRNHNKDCRYNRQQREQYCDKVGQWLGEVNIYNEDVNSTRWYQNLVKA